MVNIEYVIQQFDLEGVILSLTPLGAGHINDTFLVETSLQKYVLQRINHEVFKKPLEIMENIARVCAHQTQKLERLGEKIDRQILKIVNIKPTFGMAANVNNVIEDEGNFWRVYLYVTDTITVQEVATTNQAYEAGKAFGKFQSLLADLNPNLLHDAIPNFHNLNWRYEQLENRLKTTEINTFRLKQAENEVSFAFSKKHIAQEVTDYLQNGFLPLRVTHNDTKINNVLLDRYTGEAVCVIDLDTVMAGLVIYDFGDLMRTSLSQSAEDETNLAKVQIRMPIFKGLAEGYLSEAQHFITEQEKSLLVFGGKMITLIMGIRFLTDYLFGDIYYKTKYANHNLDRCRTQFRLVQAIEKVENEMNEIINRFSLKKC
jgi:hypothetical protein